MSPALSGSSGIQHFKYSDAIEICDGVIFDFYIIFDFYTGLSHIQCITCTCIHIHTRIISCVDLETPLLDGGDTRKDETSSLFSPGTQSSKGTATPIAAISPGSGNPSDSPSDSASVTSSSLKRAKRPPNLELSPDQNMVNLAPDVTQSVSMATESMVAAMETTSDERSGSGSVNITPRGSFISRRKGGQGEFDPTQCSTPTRRSGSISERVSLEIKKHPCEEFIRFYSQHPVFEFPSFPYSHSFFRSASGRQLLG